MSPRIVIVGRPNVGKSSLLNMLAGRRISIVDAVPGVTRDRVGTMIELPPLDAGQKSLAVELIDTGGHGVEDVQGLTAEIERQIACGVEEADLVLFVVDAQSGLLPLDYNVAQLLRAGDMEVPVLVVANKVDDAAHEGDAYEALQLGMGEPLMVSATSGYQKSLLTAAIRRKLDGHVPGLASNGSSGDEVTDGVRLAIVGKRNAGKSTLVNALVGAERVIVSEQEGTTRDSVDVRFEWSGHVFTAIDTAGVRKRKSIKQDVEYYSHHRTLRSIRRADVVLVLVDASVPISQVDTKLVSEILRHYKPCVLVVNKWDLAEAHHTQQEYMDYLDKSLRGLSYAPIVFISAEHDEGVKDVIGMALTLNQQAGHRVPTAEINRVIDQVLSERTPVSKLGRQPKVYYACQLQVHPPTIGLFVNKPHLFDANYERFLINRLRDELPYSEVPIRLLIRGRQRTPDSVNVDGEPARRTVDRE